MITIDGNVQVNDSNQTSTNVTYYGLSTDSKPTTDVGNGSCFIEMNTGNVFFFNAASGTWVNPNA